MFKWFWNIFSLGAPEKFWQNILQALHDSWCGSSCLVIFGRKAPNIFLARENIRFSTLFAAGYVSRKTSQRRRARRNRCFSQATIFCENKWLYATCSTQISLNGRRRLIYCWTFQIFQPFLVCITKWTERQWVNSRPFLPAKVRTFKVIWGWRFVWAGPG